MSSIVVAGDTSGTITIAAPAVAGSGTLTLPVATDTLAGIAATQTLTNKTLTSPTITTPTFDSASLPTISGTAPLYMCRAWVNFNGTGTVAIRASGNVSSITDNGAGDYTVNFTTALVDANYSTVISNVAFSATGTQRNSCIAGVFNSAATTYTTSAVRIVTGNPASASLEDNVIMSVSIFR